MADELSLVVRTNAGMCALWPVAAFAFADFEDWEDWATEDEHLVASIRAGQLVPVNVGGDGVFKIMIRWGAAARLTEPERRHVLVSSDPYLLVADGPVALGGLEDVGDEPDGVFDPGPGRRSVRVHLVDWKAAVEPAGRPGPDALPDFVVLIAADGGGPYRDRVRTFEPYQAAGK